jgi:hypothetical protein
MVQVPEKFNTVLHFTNPKYKNKKIPNIKSASFTSHFQEKHGKFLHFHMVHRVLRKDM